MATDALAGRYLRFADIEARGRSPLYEAYARQVARSSALLGFLRDLPPDRQQPNLFFAALRMAAALPDQSALAETVLAHRDAIATIMATRTTQTNEPGRCATLLPALGRLPGPLALIEVGASAGLCLLPDRYGFDWGGQRLAPATADAPVFPCHASPETPCPATHPTVVWRAGLDLNPLDPRSHDDMAWLEALVWPEDSGRRYRLRAAIRIATRDPPAIQKGDLCHDLDDLIASAPPDATVAVFHSAVLTYLPDQQDRDDFAAKMLEFCARGGVWISNEGPQVLPQFAPATAGPDGFFLMLVNGRPTAWTARPVDPVAGLNRPKGATASSAMNILAKGLICAF